MKKLKMKFCYLIFFSLISISLITSSCAKSESNAEPDKSYDTMIDAANAVLENVDKDLYFAYGLYLYQSQEFYDAKEISYNLTFYEFVKNSNDINIYNYVVGDSIELIYTKYRTLPENHAKSIRASDWQIQLDSIADYENLIPFVVDLAKENGEELEKDAFLYSNSLIGYFEDDMFYIGKGKYTDFHKIAQYDTSTEELIFLPSYGNNDNPDYSRAFEQPISKEDIDSVLYKVVVDSEIDEENLRFIYDEITKFDDYSLQTIWFYDSIDAAYSIEDDACYNVGELSKLEYDKDPVFFEPVDGFSQISLQQLQGLFPEANLTISKFDEVIRRISSGELVDDRNPDKEPVKEYTKIIHEYSYTLEVYEDGSWNSVGASAPSSEILIR
ncbi:hypothetical protein [Alkalibacter saccharofermentans]|uniref:Uncharacterized protein n=1 Tax=Alkalibacter saccharofermentans DSM 14828 TaxID=1120975 RepID=A0A1M4TD54_9FIRM|nr:hypothetical protein [Alkalibacter saccharofermentans]SHE42314.1 hypothetical protein SAMN02746064_00455 [Alkalibacter saccharofermentans DSM 14828]